MYCFKLICLVLIVNQCDGVIFRLNETEYSLMPKLFDLDDYDRCLEPGGVYCVARFQLFTDHGDDRLMKVIQEYSEFTPKHYNHTHIDRGVCITHSCLHVAQNKSLFEGKDQVSILAACVNESTYRDYNLNTRLANLFYCDNYDDKDGITMSDYVVAAVFTTLLILNTIGTCYHIIINIRGKNEKVKENAYIISFSVIKSFKFLTSKSSDPRQDRLKGFHCLKTIAAMGVAVAHAINPMANGYIDNPHDFEQTYDKLNYQILYNGLMTVQMFFAISGFLLVYTFKLKTNDKSLKWTMIPKIVFLRWWRLSPAYAMMLAFSATWIRHLGSGPLWSLYVKTPTEDCRLYWWKFLLYFNNYSKDGRFCSFQTWSLATDYQLTVLGVVIYVLTVRCSKGRKVVLALLLLLGVVLPGIHVWLQDLEGTMMLTPEFFRSFSSETFFKVYITGHNNMPAFIMGMATALLVHHWMEHGVDLSQYKILRYLLRLVIPVTLLFFYSGSVFFSEVRPSLLTRALYASAQRLVMAALVTYVITGLVMRVDPFLSRIFEWDGWRIPGRISYCVFLLHVIFIQIISGYKTELAHFSFQNLISIQLAVLSATFVAALPFYLLIEAPMNAVIKNLTEDKKTDPVSATPKPIQYA